MNKSYIQLERDDLRGVFGGCGRFTANEFASCFTVTDFDKIYPPNLTITVAKAYPASNFSASVILRLSELFKPVKEVVSQISRNLEIPLTGRYDQWDVECLVGYFAHTEDFDLGISDTAFTFDAQNTHLKNSALLCRRTIPEYETEEWCKLLRALDNPRYMGIAKPFESDLITVYWSSTYSRIFDDSEVLLASLVADSLNHNVYEKIQTKFHRT